MSATFLMGWVWMHRSIGIPNDRTRSTSALEATSNPPPAAATALRTAGWGAALIA